MGCCDSLLEIQEWQKRWDADDKGRVTYQFFPNIKARLNTKFRFDGITTQILSGHGNFRSYLQRIGRLESGKCICESDELDTIQHRIFDCENYRNERERLMAITENWPVDLATVGTLLPRICDVLKQFNSETVQGDEVIRRTRVCRVNE
jgi:hypothetical protein